MGSALLRAASTYASSTSNSTMTTTTTRTNISASVGIQLVHDCRFTVAELGSHEKRPARMRKREEEESVWFIFLHGQLYIDGPEVVWSDNIIMSVQISHARRH